MKKLRFVCISRRRKKKEKKLPIVNKIFSAYFFKYYWEINTFVKFLFSPVVKETFNYHLSKANIFHRAVPGPCYIIIIIISI